MTKVDRESTNTPLEEGGEEIRGKDVGADLNNEKTGPGVAARS